VLVEQDGVHRFVAYRERRSLAITNYEGGIQLFYILGHKAESLCAFWIEFLLVTEGNRRKSKERFAALATGLFLLLVRQEGGHRAKSII